MTYDFNVKIKDVDGKEIDKTIGILMAEFIGTETKGHTLKLYGWMKRLQVADPLELDEADKKTLQDLIENTDRVNINLKGQILDILK